MNPTPGSTARACSRPRTSRSPRSPTTSRSRTPSVWVDLCGPVEGRSSHELAAELGLHELAVEDALEPAPAARSSTTTPPTSSCPATPCGSTPSEARLDETEIDAFISTRWLITVRKDDGFAMDPVLQRWDRSPDLAAHGVSFLLYGLLDVVVDGYFDTVQAFDDFYDEVSEGIFADEPARPGQATALVRDAPSARAVPPPGRARCARRSAA